MANRSTQKYAWNQILTGRRSAEWRDETRSMFPSPDLDELYEFSPLHKAVLGLTSQSVDSVIGTETNLIDQTDSDGRTALSWAAGRDDKEALQTILSYTPDLNKNDHLGRSPLHYAVATSRECSNLLLQAGADIHARDRTLRTMLHRAMLGFLWSDTQLINLLMQAGVDVNARDSSGFTAIAWAAHYKEVAILECFIRHGANPDVCTNIGHNVLSKVTQSNFHAHIDLLLREHQDHTGSIDQEGTFMHLAAKYADTKTLQLLKRGRLQRRDINAKDPAGMTPNQLALQRTDVGLEWREAFCDFLRSIDEDLPPPFECSSSEVAERAQEAVAPSGDFDTSSTSSGEGDRSDADFEDAVEVQV